MIHLKLTDKQGVRLQQLLQASADPADKKLLREIQDQIYQDARNRPDDDEDEDELEEVPYVSGVSQEAQDLAFTFARKCHHQFTDAEWDAIRERNATNQESACATHDFADANMIMAEAFEEQFCRQSNVSDAADTELWNEAWDFAKRHYLTRAAE